MDRQPTFLLYQPKQEVLVLTPHDQTWRPVAAPLGAPLEV